MSFSFTLQIFTTYKRLTPFQAASLSYLYIVFEGSQKDGLIGRSVSQLHQSPTQGQQINKPLQKSSTYIYLWASTST